MWLVVHLTFLTGFKNRLSALANWTVAFLGRGRRQRTITEQQVLARTRAPEPRDPASTAAPSSQHARRPPMIRNRTNKEKNDDNRC